MSFATKRKHSRAPLTARVIAHDGQDLAYLNCGTISEGGMSLSGTYSLWNYNTIVRLWKSGTVLRLNIKSENLPRSFVAEG